MFNRKPKTDSLLNEEIARTIIVMRDVDIHTAEYDILMDKVDKLTKLKTDNSRDLPSSNTLINAGVNLAGILLIIRHENVNVITSKALGFVSKLK